MIWDGLLCRHGYIAHQAACRRVRSHGRHQCADNRGAAKLFLYFQSWENRSWRWRYVVFGPRVKSRSSRKAPRPRCTNMPKPGGHADRVITLVLVRTDARVVPRYLTVFPPARIGRDLLSLLCFFRSLSLVFGSHANKTDICLYDSQASPAGGTVDRRSADLLMQPVFFCVSRTQRPTSSIPS